MPFAAASAGPSSSSSVAVDPRAAQHVPRGEKAPRQRVVKPTPAPPSTHRQQLHGASTVPKLALPQSGRTGANGGPTSPLRSPVTRVSRAQSARDALRRGGSPHERQPTEKQQVADATPTPSPRIRTPRIELLERVCRQQADDAHAVGEHVQRHRYLFTTTPDERARWSPPPVQTRVDDDVIEAAVRAFDMSRKQPQPTVDAQARHATDDETSGDALLCGIAVQTRQSMTAKVDSARSTVFQKVRPPTAPAAGRRSAPDHRSAATAEDGAVEELMAENRTGERPQLTDDVVVDSLGRLVCGATHLHNAAVASRAARPHTARPGSRAPERLRTNAEMQLRSLKPGEATKPTPPCGPPRQQAPARAAASDRPTTISAGRRPFTARAFRSSLQTASDTTTSRSTAVGGGASSQSQRSNTRGKLDGVGGAGGEEPDDMYVGPVTLVKPPTVEQMHERRQRSHQQLVRHRQQLMRFRQRRKEAAMSVAAKRAQMEEAALQNVAATDVAIRAQQNRADSARRQQRKTRSPPPEKGSATSRARTGGSQQRLPVDRTAAPC